MAVRSLIGTSTDFEAVANWSGAAAPVTGDSAYLMTGSQTFASNLDQSDQDLASLRFGEDWEGKILTTGPLILGATTTILINSPNCTELALSQADAHTSPNTYIYATGTGANAVYLNAGAAQTGVYTNVYITGGNVHIGAKATITNLYVYDGATVLIDSGAAITTINQLGGNIYNSAAVTTVNLWSGTFYHQGTTTVNITTVTLHGPDALFLLNSLGAALGTVNVYAGLFDGTRVGHANTVGSVAAGTIQHGARVWLNQQTTVTNDFNDFTLGEGYRGPASSTTEMIPPIPL